MSARSVVTGCKPHDCNPSKELDSCAQLPRVSLLERVIESVPTRDVLSLTDDFVTRGFSLLYQHSLQEFGAQLATASTVHADCVTAVSTRLQAVVRGLSQSVLSLLDPSTSGLTEPQIRSTLRHGCFQINLCSLNCFWQGIGTQTPPHWGVVVGKALSTHPGFDTPALRHHFTETLHERIKKFYVDLPGFELQFAGLGRDFITLRYVGLNTDVRYEFTPTRL
jgi:hypothetical protein